MVCNTREVKMVEGKILGLLEDAEGAGQFADLSMEDCTDGAMDMDEV